MGNAQDKLLREVPEKPYKRKMVEQRRVPQVRAIYSYNGHGIDVVKGELMFLLAKSNKDWWNVRTASGNDGFVPANYVKVHIRYSNIRYLFLTSFIVSRRFYGRFFYGTKGLKSIPIKKPTTKSSRNFEICLKKVYKLHIVYLFII